MRVLGIDPGTAMLGYGLVEEVSGELRAPDYGCIRTGAGETLPQRLNVLHANLQRLLDFHRPDLVAVEELFFSRNARTALAVGQARGVALLAAAQRELSVREYTPLQVKQAVVGYGRAEKAQVQLMVQRILRLGAPPRPDDAADALAVAVCCLHRRRLEEIMGGGGGDGDAGLG